MDDKLLIARRVARELRPGYLVDLDIGLPTLVWMTASGRPDRESTCLFRVVSSCSPVANPALHHGLATNRRACHPVSKVKQSYGNPPVERPVTAAADVRAAVPE
jgi:hypothetical protein